MAQKKGPKGPCYDVVILPESVSETELKVRAVVTKDGSREPNIPVVFLREDTPEVNGMITTNPQGEAPWTYRLPSGTVTANVSAEAIVPGTYKPVRKVSVPITSEKKAGAARKVADFQIEPTKLGEGRFRLSFLVFDDNELGTPAVVNIVPSDRVTIDGIKVTTPTEFTIPDTGMRSLLVEVEVEKIELDVIVVGTKWRQQLKLYGAKKTINPGPRPKAKDGFWANLFWNIK